jgi:hypothetical protein
MQSTTEQRIKTLAFWKPLVETQGINGVEVVLTYRTMSFSAELSASVSMIRRMKC